MTTPIDKNPAPSESTPVVPLIPRTVLFGNPERIAPAVSPDASALAWIAPDEGVLNLWVRDLHGDAGSERVLTKDRDRGIRSFAWAPDGVRLLYVQDTGGDENWRLYDIHLETGETRCLTPFDNVQARIVAVSRRRPGVILLGLNRDQPTLHDVYRLDLATAELVQVAKNPGFAAIFADHDLRLRGAVTPMPDGSTAILVRDDEESAWRPLLVADMEDALSTTPVTFSQDGTRLLCITSVGTDTAELAWFDVTTGEREFVAGDPTYDVASAALHIDTYEPRVVFFLRERLHAQILDETITEDMATLTALDDGGDLAILGSDNADTVWLVAKSNDNAPTRYYTYDRASRAVRFLFTTQPALERYQLAKKEPITVIARDGLQLHGYVTFPPGVQHRGLPAVLKVHGGPWSRDVWGLDAEAQWMANRGYACIEINFRGSRGYGKAFLTAGNREWGAKMQDDLLDAVDWTVAQGWVDPNRVAIYGGSYGGYAALVAATFTPDRFACAVAMAAPVNLITLIKAFPNFLKPMIAQAHVRVGNPDTDADFLWSRSPLSRAGDIGIPVLLVQGVNDPRVPQDECDQIRTALDAKGIAYDYLQFEDGHGLARPQDRERFSLAVERFLGEHLGGRVETTQHAQPASL